MYFGRNYGEGRDGRRRCYYDRSNDRLLCGSVEEGGSEEDHRGLRRAGAKGGGVREMMTMNRRSARLKGHDYSEPGWYFITLNTKNRGCYFGLKQGGVILPSRAGEIAIACWNELPLHFAFIEIDEFVLMPDHVHGILRIVEYRRRDVQLNIPTDDYFSRISPGRGSLAVVVRTYKAAVTTICRQNGIGEFQWQRGYHDHIIHNPDSLARIRIYIKSNPLRS